MTRFACGRCGAVLSADLIEVAMTPYAVDDEEEDGSPPSLMAPGTYAVDPKPFGPPNVPVTSELARLHGIDDATLRRWEQDGPGRGPMHISAGPTGTLVVHPDDALGLRRHPDSGRLNGCCDLDGCDGPNLVCAGCGAEVATLQNDCWVGRTTLRFEPPAVRATVD